MAEVTHFQGAELGDFRVLAGAPVHDTAVSRFTTQNARCSIRIGGGPDGSIVIESRKPFSATEFWVHWKVSFNVSSAAVSRYNFLRLLSGGVERLGLRIPAAPTTSSLTRFEVYKSGGVLLGTSADFADMSEAPPAAFAMRVKLGNPGSIRIYRGKIPVFAADDLDLTWSGVTSIEHLRICTATNNGSFVAFYSEIILADWNTIGGKLVTGSLRANGAYSEWAGAGYAALNEITPAATTLTSAAADQRVSVATTAFPATGPGERIERVQITANAVRDGSGPQKMNFFYRVAGADHHGADLALIAAPADYSDEWAKSPATGTYWTPAELNASEPGVRSRT